MFWLSDVFTGTDAAQQMRRYEARARAARATILQSTVARLGNTLRPSGAALVRAVQRRRLDQALPRELRRGA